MRDPPTANVSGAGGRAEFPEATSLGAQIDDWFLARCAYKPTGDLKALKGFVTEVLNCPDSVEQVRGLSGLPRAGREPAMSEGPIARDLGSYDGDSATKGPTPQGSAGRWGTRRTRKWPEDCA